jgi:hypothetical protein
MNLASSQTENRQCANCEIPHSLQSVEEKTYEHGHNLI